MKHFLLLLLSGGALLTVAHGANTALIHPGEIIYARFTQKGLKLKLVSTSKEKDEQAQVIFELAPVDPTRKEMIAFKVTNKFALELHYKAEVKMMKNIFPLPATTSRAVGGKMASTELPPFTEEVTIFEFELEK